MQKEVPLGARTTAFPEEIIRLVARQNYTVIHFRDGSSLLSSTNLGVLEERLQPYAFFRMNRSTVINLNHLNRFTIHPHKVHPHWAKDKRKNSRKKTTEIFLSRRRVAAFQACVNA